MVYCYYNIRMSGNVNMDIKKKSVIPVYGVAVVWVLFCIFSRLYTTLSFIVLACVAVLAYTLLATFFPGKTVTVEIPEEPEHTGDEKIDALLAEGAVAVSEMRRLRDSIAGDMLKEKIDNIISITDKIFKDLLEDPEDYNLVKRFADFYLPTTINLLHTYDRFGSSGVEGDNITSAMERIDAALDRISDSYIKFFDSLFENQALDIEADINVLESLLKRDGLMENDFNYRDLLTF